MAISEQFKSLNLNPGKMRKLCTIEVGGVEMKKNAKRDVLQFEKKKIIIAFFWLLFCLSISKTIC